MGVQGSSLVPILPGFQVNFFECANELIFGYFVCFYIRCTAKKLTCFHNTKELVAFSMSVTEHFRLNTAVVFYGCSRCKFPKQLLSNSVYVQMVNSAIEGEELQNLIVSLQSTNFGTFLQPRSLTKT